MLVLLSHSTSYSHLDSTGSYKVDRSLDRIAYYYKEFSYLGICILSLIPLPICDHMTLVEALSCNPGKRTFDFLPDYSNIPTQMNK